MAPPRSGKLTKERWVRLLSRQHNPAGEEIILIRRLREPYGLAIPKLDIKRCFGPCAGIGLKKGAQILVVGTNTDSRIIELPNWAIRQLKLKPKDYVCVSRKRDDGSSILRRFELVAGRTKIPGRTIIDSSTDTTVTRTHYSWTDINTIKMTDLRALLSGIGKFRHDPLEPFEGVGGRMGFLFRREFEDHLTKEDESFTKQYRHEILCSQKNNASWNDSMVETGFDIIRLMETGEGVENPSVEKAARWLLSTPEPSGLPGLFMATVGLTEEFNEWKDHPATTAPPGTPRYRSDVSELYHKVNQRGSRTKQYQSVRDAYRRNSDVVPGICELALTSSSAIVLQALIRLGFKDEKRVRTAVNTLLYLWHGRWCGCGYLGHGRRIPANDGPVDFDRIPRPSTNTTIYRLDWFTNTKEIIQIVGSQNVSPHFYWLDVGENQALIEKSSVGMGDCTLGIHQALSYHPGYAGSNLEAIAALEFSRRQSSTGRWGDTPVSTILDNLRRLSHPLSAFLVLRTIPLLIREQQPDGFWAERGTGPSSHEGMSQQIHNGAPRELVTLRILRALKRFGFLKALLPNN